MWLPQQWIFINTWPIFTLFSACFSSKTPSHPGNQSQNYIPLQHSNSSCILASCKLFAVPCLERCTRTKHSNVICVMWKCRSDALCVLLNFWEGIQGIPRYDKIPWCRKNHVHVSHNWSKKNKVHCLKKFSREPVHVPIHPLLRENVQPQITLPSSTCGTVEFPSTFNTSLGLSKKGWLKILANLLLLLWMVNYEGNCEWSSRIPQASLRLTLRPLKIIRPSQKDHHVLGKKVKNILPNGGLQ